MTTTIRILYPLLLLLLATPAEAEVQDKIIEYRDGDTLLRGHLYWDDRTEKQRPGVLAFFDEIFQE